MVTIHSIKKQIKSNWGSNSSATLRFFDNYCTYCGVQLSKHGTSRFNNDPIYSRTYDHVIPRSSNKKKDSNLVPSCKRCNQLKKSLNLLEFLFRYKKRLHEKGLKFIVEKKKNIQLFKKLCPKTKIRRQKMLHLIHSNLDDNLLSLEDLKNFEQLGCPMDKLIEDMEYFYKEENSNVIEANRIFNKNRQNRGET